MPATSVMDAHRVSELALVDSETSVTRVRRLFTRLEGLEVQVDSSGYVLSVVGLHLDDGLEDGSA